MKVSTNEVYIKKAVKALNVLNITDLIQALKTVSEQYAWSANDLRQAWDDPEAGKVWDIAAQGLEKTAEDIEKHLKGL